MDYIVPPSSYEDTGLNTGNHLLKWGIVKRPLMTSTKSQFNLSGLSKLLQTNFQWTLING